MMNWTGGARKRAIRRKHKDMVVARITDPPKPHVLGLSSSPSKHKDFTDFFKDAPPDSPVSEHSDLKVRITQMNHVD